MSAKGILGALVLFLCSSLLGLALLEVGVRLYSGIPVFAIQNFVKPTTDIIRANSMVMDHHPLLGWELKPGFGAPDSGFTTEAFGIRTNGSRRESLPAGAILAVGDSFTAGSGLRDSDAWPAVLERIVGQPVLNGAAGAYGTDQIVLRAEYLAERVKPATIVVGILSQDNLRNAYKIYAGGFKPWFEVVDGKAELRGVPVPNVATLPRDLHWTRNVFGYSYLVHFMVIRTGRLQWWVDNNFYVRAMSDQTAVDVSCKLMTRLDELRRRTSARIIVTLFWGASEAETVPAPWYGQPPLRCAEALGIEVLDFHPILNTLSRDKAAYAKLWIDEGGVLGHPSVEGAKLIAERLGDLILRR